MKKDKALPFRVAFTFVLLLLDFIIIPQILLAPIYLKQGNISSFSITFLGWVSAIPVVKGVWLWLQPAVIGAVVWIWLTGRSLVNVNHNSLVPQASGHGQHGTARWQTIKEIDKNFKVHHF